MNMYHSDSEMNSLIFFFVLLSSLETTHSEGAYGHSAPLGEHSVRPPVMSILLQVKSEQLDVEPQRM